MKKSNGYYMRSYLKNNWLVLLCELVIVLLLALICTVVIGGQPAWLTPLMAVTAYLLAEIRFMMAYVATLATKAQEEDQAEAQEDDLLPSEVTEPEDEKEVPEQLAEDDSETVEEPTADKGREQEPDGWIGVVDEEAGEDAEPLPTAQPDEQDFSSRLQDEATEAPAELELQVDAASVDEPDAEDVFIILEDDEELPASKTLDLGEDI